MVKMAGPGGEANRVTTQTAQNKGKHKWWSDKDNGEQKDLVTGNSSVHPSTCSTSGSSSLSGITTVICFSFLQAEVWIVWYLWCSWSFTVNVTLTPWQCVHVLSCVSYRQIRTSRCLHGLQYICPRPPHMSAVRRCVTADIDELIHSQLQPLMMSPPTAAKRRLTFLIVLLFSTGSRGLSLDDVLAFVWLPLVQLGVRLMKGTLLENIRGLRWFHQAQISSPTR